MNWLIRNVLLSSLLTGATYAYIKYSETDSFPDLANEWPGITLAILCGISGSVVLHLMNDVLNRVIPWSKKQGLRILAEIILFLCVYGIIGALFYTFFLETRLTIERDVLTESVLRYAIILLVMGSAVALIKFNLYSYNQYAVVHLKNLEILRDQTNLRFEALKSQLSPHFLFNSLNTVSSLAYKDTLLAEKYIRKLADTYNLLLSNEQEPLIPLHEELRILNSFFFMQKIKFGDRIDLNIHVEEDQLQSRIPPLTLQLLVENAIKHNHIGESFPLNIRVNSDSEHISVSNNINKSAEKGTKAMIESFHIGLSNIRKRYNYFSQSPVEVEQNGAFIVRLPVILENHEH